MTLFFCLFWLIKIDLVSLGNMKVGSVFAHYYLIVPENVFIGVCETNTLEDIDNMIHTQSSLFLLFTSAV